MHKVYHRIDNIAGNVINIKADDVQYKELAEVVSRNGSSLAQVIKINGDNVALVIPHNDGIVAVLFALVPAPPAPHAHDGVEKIEHRFGIEAGVDKQPNAEQAADNAEYIAGP